MNISSRFGMRRRRPSALLSSHKGNIAHHLKVLRGACLVTPAGTRQVRGGTEQYYQRAARILHFAGEHSAASTVVSVGSGVGLGTPARRRSGVYRGWPGRY
jgi:hypothetical protein